MKTFWCRNVPALARGTGLAILVAGLFTVGCFTAAAQEKLTLEDIHAAKVDPNVIYGMYSGLALVMDVYHPAQPNGYAVVFVHGGHWRMSPEVGAAPFKDGGNIVQLVQFIKPMISAGYTVFVPEYRMAPHFLPPAEERTSREPSASSGSTRRNMELTPIILAAWAFPQERKLSAWSACSMASPHRMTFLLQAR